VSFTLTNWRNGQIFYSLKKRTFIKNIRWPDRWTGFVAHAGSLGCEGFRNALDAYRKPRDPLLGRVGSGAEAVREIAIEPACMT
jgi:hypothetical protein